MTVTYSHCHYVDSLIHNNSRLCLSSDHPGVLHGALPRYLPPALPVRHGWVLQGCQGGHDNTRYHFCFLIIALAYNTTQIPLWNVFFQIIALVWLVSFLSALPYAFFTKLNYIHRPLSSNRTEDILDDSAFCALLDENIYPQAKITWDLNMHQEKINYLW